MKKKLLWAVEHWFLLIPLAMLTMAILTLAGVTPRPDASRFFEDRPYTGEGLVWQETPDSDCFSYVGYDEGYEVLALVFRSNETRTYLYSEITGSDYQELLAADSMGRFYNRNIKGRYPRIRIDDAEGTWYSP